MSFSSFYSKMIQKPNQIHLIQIKKFWNTLTRPLLVLHVNMWQNVPVISFSISALFKWNEIKVFMNCLCLEGYFFVLLFPSVPVPHHPSSTEVTATFQLKYSWHHKEKEKKTFIRAKNWTGFDGHMNEGKMCFCKTVMIFFFFFFKKVGNPLIISKTQNVPHGFEATLRRDVSLVKMSLIHQKNSESFSPIKTALPEKTL